MRLGLSTTWNAYRHTLGKPLIFEIKEAGFGYVELGFNLTSAMVKDAADAACEAGIGILSLHNYCPIPDGVKREVALPDFVSLASCDRDQRLQAVEYTKHTIRTAERLGACCAVLHCGRVEIPDKTRELITLYNPAGTQSREFIELRDRHIRERAAAARPFFDNALASLEEIAREAERCKITLGIENRFYYREIPGFDEIAGILDRFQGAPLAYWHDTGHAQLMQHLGFAEHEDHLKRYGSRIAGMHLHDIAGCKDHQPIGKGVLNFKRILSYAQGDPVLILEIHKPAVLEDLITSKKAIETICNG